MFKLCCSTVTVTIKHSFDWGGCGDLFISTMLPQAIMTNRVGTTLEVWSVANRWQVCDASQVVGLIWSVTFSKGYIFESSNHIYNSFLLKTFQFWAPYHIDLSECLHSTAHNINNFGVSNDFEPMFWKWRKMQNFNSQRRFVYITPSNDVKSQFIFKCKYIPHPYNHFHLGLCEYV